MTWSEYIKKTKRKNTLQKLEKNGKKNSCMDISSDKLARLLTRKKEKPWERNWISQNTKTNQRYKKHILSKWKTIIRNKIASVAGMKQLVW